MSLERAVNRIFEPEGTLSRVVERFEWRPQQVEMARGVMGALTDGSTCVIEAPTGVGKSLAYLVPGALWCRDEGGVVLISTHTRNLQDQILRRDLPILRRLVSRKIEIAVLKGRGNYLCRRRYERAREDLTGTTDGEALLRALEGWVSWTESGDFDDGPPISGRLRGLLGRISSDARFCASRECAPESGCFYKRSRRKARETPLVLVNHSLLVLDLLGEGGGLPPRDGLIVDEAHHLPRVAADALALRISERSWRQALLGLGGQGEPGATDQIRRSIRSWSSAVDRSQMLRRLRELESELGELLDLSHRFFEEIRHQDGYPRAGARQRYRLGAGAGGPFPDSTFPLLEASRNLLERHTGLLQELRVRSGGNDQEAALSEIERSLEAARNGWDSLGSLTDAADSGIVYWMEDDPNEGAVLRSRPLDLSGTLGERLDAGHGLVLTSATLAADGSASYFVRQCGLPDAEEMILPPVFPLEKQVLSIAPDTIHDPTDPKHLDDLVEGIRRVAVAIPRKALILFTSHETLRAVESKLTPSLEDRGIRVFAQGGEASRSSLTESFQKSERAVLLGAASFWEGVDFPGEELEILVMVRLPFPVPTDPFVEAFSERLREEGQDPFSTFMVPEAIVRFRQGFGRLIRRQDDRGVFLVLDPRIMRRGYGARFRDALGIRTQGAGSWDELVRETENWFRGNEGIPTEESNE